MTKMSQVIGQFLVVSAMAFALPSVSMASDDQSERHAHMDKREHDGKRDHKMFEALNLDDNQKEQVKTLMQEHRDNMKAEREAFVARLDKILTPEQQEKAKAMRQKHEEKRRNREEN